MIHLSNDWRKSIKNNVIWFELISLGIEKDSFKGEFYIYLKVLGLGLEISWVYSKTQAEEWKRFLEENELEGYE